jgi:hypothetical protein
MRAVDARKRGKKVKQICSHFAIEQNEKKNEETHGLAHISTMVGLCMCVCVRTRTNEKENLNQAANKKENTRKKAI